MDGKTRGQRLSTRKWITNLARTQVLSCVMASVICVLPMRNLGRPCQSAKESSQIAATFASNGRMHRKVLALTNNVGMCRY